MNSNIISFIVNMSLGYSQHTCGFNYYTFVNLIIMRETFKYIYYTMSVIRFKIDGIFYNKIVL